LIWRANDYFADFEKASVTRHIWTLAVEEQYYIVWPFIFLGLAAVAKKVTQATERPATRVLLAEGTAVSPPTPSEARNLVLCLTAFEAFAIIFSQGLGWHIYQTQGASPAYYHTFTRAGDFAVGGLAACSVYLLPTAAFDRYQRKPNLPPMGFNLRILLEAGSAANVIAMFSALIQGQKEMLLQSYFQWFRLPLAVVALFASIPQTLQTTEPLPQWAIFTRFICCKPLCFLGVTLVTLSRFEVKHFHRFCAEQFPSLKCLNLC
jgi:peptidoglycan/LPS O-acetylase OafA/YrhL